MNEEAVQQGMDYLNLDDWTTELNTQLNRSGVLMDIDDNSVDSVQKRKVRKSITLNLEIQPSVSISKSLKPIGTLKGILKKADNNVVRETGRDYYQKIQNEGSSETEPRPHNLEEFSKTEGLVISGIESTFNTSSLCDDDEIWLMEIPKSINPTLLEGHILSLTDKTKLKIGDDRYMATHRDIKGGLTCVLKAEKSSTLCKTKNIKPAGMIQIRQKLTIVPKITPNCAKKTKIPLPKNIKYRDPFLGVVADARHLKKESGSRRIRGGLITCGSDGDVRSWLSLMDDDPASTCVSEQATTVISKNGKIYVGNDNNTVQILDYPDLEKEGVVTRFAAKISALASSKKSKLIASGACDMRIHVTNIDNLHNIQLTGHTAPILGLSLDPKEEFVASSSADGTIRVWSIKERRSVHVWNNVVPKCNSFLTAKLYCTPSFNCKSGDVLAYPHGKDVVITERLTWKEICRLKCPNLKTELSICKFSECGTRIAASSFYGEIIVWDLESKSVLGYIEHKHNAKVTALVWHPDKPKEIAFCDALGQLGCVEVGESEISLNEVVSKPVMNNHVVDNNLEVEDDDDDAENISLDKIKSSVNSDPVHRNISRSLPHGVVKESRKLSLEVNLQEAFQPSSTPVHLFSRYMVWNDTGIVTCLNSEDGGESNILVQFHDVSIHHSMYINNYLHHTLAALSRQALALSCISSEGIQSKLVVVVLQGWGSGNKEWSIDFPEGENAQCLAVGNNFIAVATDRRNLRLFMIGGTQREIIALPGSVVAMNAYDNHLLVTHHVGIGAPGDQHMSMLWIRIVGSNLRSQKLDVPLSPLSKLSWLGISDLYSPIIMDTQGIIKIYDKKSCIWRVACDADRQPKGKMDHFFLVGVSESERLVRCILCKGSYYPPINPKPIVHEIPLVIPLCEPDTEKSEKEAEVWRLGSHPKEEKEAVLTLIALACRNNVEFRALELCQQIASQQVIELAIKYAARNNKMALANKLESIGEKEDSQELDQEIKIHDNCVEEKDNEIMEEPFLASMIKKAQIEIKPLSFEQIQRKRNPFLKKENPPAIKGLSALDVLEKPQQPKISMTAPKHKLSSTTNVEKKDSEKQSFVNWFSRNKKVLQEEFPDISITGLTKIGLAKFKEISQNTDSEEKNIEIRKRKLSDSQETSPCSQLKRSVSSKLAVFANDE